MANKLIQDLTATAVPASDTVVPVVRNGESVAEKATVANLAKGMSSVGKVAVTQPATASTITVVDGATLTVNGSATITNGTHSGSNSGDQDLSGLMVKASNLSDVASAATARDNLGVDAKWEVVNTAVDVSPAVNQKSYIVDCTGATRTITLPDSAAANDGHVYRIVMGAGANNVIVTTASGTQLVGGQVSQTIVSTNTGFTVQSDFANTRYVIVQDSRAKAPLSSITFYGLSEASDLGGGALKLASTTSDSDYSQTPTDQTSGSITGSDQLIGTWASMAGRINGLVSETVATMTFKVRRTAGNTGGSFYCKLYHRASGGAETLLGTSGVTPSVTSATYVQLDISSLVATQNFISTDRFVVKFYGTKVGGGTDPTFDIELEGTTPARITIPVASSSISLESLSGILPVAKGGTGRSSATAYAVKCGGTTDTAAEQSVAALGSAGQVLTSNGAGALPTFQDATGGTANNYLYAQVRVASTANVTVATLNNGDTVDGVAVATGDRVLLKDQTAGAENGIYVVAAAEGDTARATDYNTDAEIRRSRVLVQEGTANAGKVFADTNASAITVDTTAITYTVQPTALREFNLTAAGMWPSTTSGCASAAKSEFGTNDVDIVTLDFDKDADEYAQVTIPSMPTNWDGGTLTAKFKWTASAGTATETVQWMLQGRALANDDAIDQAWGTAVGVSDALIAVGDAHETAETAAITMAGSPAGNQMLQLRVYRDVSEDTLAADAKLIGVLITYGVKAV